MQAVTRVIAGRTRRAYVRVRFCQAPKQFPVRTERASTYAYTGRVSTGDSCVPHAVYAALDYFHAVFVVRSDPPVHDCG